MRIRRHRLRCRTRRRICWRRTKLRRGLHVSVVEKSDMILSSDGGPQMVIAAGGDPVARTLTACVLLRDRHQGGPLHYGSLVTIAETDAEGVTTSSPESHSEEGHLDDDRGAGRMLSASLQQDRLLLQCPSASHHHLKGSCRFSPRLTRDGLFEVLYNRLIVNDVDVPELLTAASVCALKNSPSDRLELMNSSRAMRPPSVFQNFRVPRIGDPTKSKIWS